MFPSFYIHRLHTSITERNIRDVFENFLGKGTIGQIYIENIINSRSKSKIRSNWNKVYVYPKKWLSHLSHIKQALLNGEVIYIDSSYFVGYSGTTPWRCIRNTKTHFASTPRDKKYTIRDCNVCGELVYCDTNSSGAKDLFGLSARCNTCNTSNTSNITGQVSMFQRWQQQF